MSNKLVKIIFFKTKILPTINHNIFSDDFIHELVTAENYKQIMDLVILGFDELVPIIEAKFGGEDKMRDNGLSDQADQIYTVIPQVQVIRNQIKLSV